MDKPTQTIFQLINYSLRTHPELASLVENICREVQGNKSEFQENINRWFSNKGDETLRLDYPLGAHSLVFDLGGYLGDFTAEITGRYNCSVFLFEPSIQFFSHCVQRFKSNPKIKCFNYALSDEEGAFKLSKEDNSSSISRVSGGVTYEEIVVKNISRVIADLGVQEISLMKINIEGAEFGVLSDLISSGLISRINNVQVQFHEFYQNSWKLRDQIRLGLSKTHQESWNYPFVWESWARKA
jgi:FkbM family methyltransferase